MADREHHQPSTQTSDVFVSYAHHDRSIALALIEDVRARGRTAWVDLEGIPPSAAWMVEIEAAILDAQAFVFLISPGSASSRACAQEARIATDLHKKIVPILITDVDPALLPPGVAASQWIDARAGHDVAGVVEALLRAVDTDLTWIRGHTRLLHEATRWHADHEGTSLLEGRELLDAEAWLQAAPAHTLAPTREQVTFVRASRWALSLEQAETLYARAFELAGAGRKQAAAAHLLRAVETAPPGGTPEGFPLTPGRAGWAEDAWTAYRYLSADRGHLRGRLRAPAPVSCVALDADAAHAVVGCLDGSVQLWDLDTCALIRTLGGISDPVTAVALSPAQEVVAAGADGSVLAWAAPAWGPRVLWRSEGNPVTALAFAPGGRLSAFGLRDGYVILNGRDGRRLREARLHGGSVTHLQLDDRGRLLTGSGRPVSGEWLSDGTAISSDALRGPGQPLVLGTLQGSPIAVVPSCDGQKALRSLAGGVVELSSGAEHDQARLLVHRETVRALAFGVGTATAITGCDDGQVRIWDVATGQERAAFDGHLAPVTGLVLSADGRILVSCSLDASVAVWDLDRPAGSREITPDAGTVTVTGTGRIAVGAGQGQITLLDRHGGGATAVERPGPVTSIVLTPDASTLVSGYDDGTLTVWDVPCINRIRQLAGHGRRIWDLALSPDTAMLASASEDGTVRLWTMSDGSGLALLAGHEGTVSGVAFTPDGDNVVTCGEDGTARLWSTADGRQTRLVGRVPKHHLMSVAITPDGLTVVVASTDGSVHLWPIHEPAARRWGRSGRQINAHRRSVRRVVVSPDGHRLLTASFDASVTLWDLASGRKIRAFTGHDGCVNDVLFGPGAQIFSAGMDGLLQSRDLDSGRQNNRCELSQRIDSIALSADGTTVAAGTSDGVVRVWGSDHGPAKIFTIGHSQAVEGLTFSPDGSRLASVARDRTIRLWDVEGKQQLLSRPLPRSGARTVWHPTQPRLVCATGDRHTLVRDAQAFGSAGGRTARAGPSTGGAFVWDLDLDADALLASAAPQRLERHEGVVFGIAASSRKQIVTAGQDASVRVWDAVTGRQVRRLTGHHHQVWAVAVTPDGSVAASASIDNDIRLWDLDTGRLINVLEHHTAGVGSLGFILGGTRLVSASADRTVRIVDVATGEQVRLLPADEELVAVAVDPGGRRAVTGTLAGGLLLWDLNETGTSRPLPAHGDSIWGIAISPDARTAVTSSEDGTACVWDLDTVTLRHTLSARTVPLRQVAISPDGSEVAVGSADYAVRCWDLSSGELTGILTGLWSDAISVAYDPDGSAVYAGGEDGTVLGWERGQEDPLDWVAGTSSDVLAVDCDPSGERILVGGADGSLRLWAAERGEMLSVLTGHTGPVTDLHILPDGRRAVSGAMDGTVRAWDLGLARETHLFADNQGPVTALLLQAAGDVLVSASIDGTVFVRSLRTGRLLRRIAGPKARGFDLAMVSESGATMQLSVGGDAGYTVLAAGPDGDSVLAASGRGVVELRLLPADTPRTPPRVDPEQTDPYAGFADLYRSVGLRVVRDGHDAGNLTLA